MFGTAYEGMSKLFLLIAYSWRLLVGKQNAKDSDTVGMTAEPMCLGVYYIFHPLLSFIFVPCSKVFSAVHF